MHTANMPPLLILWQSVNAFFISSSPHLTDGLWIASEAAALSMWWSWHNQCIHVFFFLNFIKESFKLLISALSPPLPHLLLPFLVYVSCLFRTDNRIILKILLLVLQKQSIRIQNREKSILDLLYFCKKNMEPKLICVLHQIAQTISN